MKNVFVTSDTHFGHANIITYCNRPFASVEEMDEAMIARWNAVVKPEDKVYHLGDVYMSKSYGRAERTLARLNGTKVLILGNHDNGKDQHLLKFFKRVYAYRFLPDFQVTLTHIPIHVDSIQRRTILNIHGHTHDKGSPPGPYRSACVELHDYTPVAIEELRDAPHTPAFRK